MMPLLQTGRSRISNEAIVVLVIALLGATICASVGIFSDVSLGDEVYHFYSPQHWVESGQRPISDPLINASPRAERKYMKAPLWHGGLAVIWSLTGIGQTTAQLYQAAWYIVLVLAVYDLGRRLYDRRVGMWSAGLMACMPFVAAFSNMLYVDIMVMGVVALMLGCLVRRRFVIASIILGLAFLTKRNSYFLVPGFFFIVAFLAGGSWKRRLLWMGICAAIAMAIHTPDLVWRHINLGSVTMHPKGPAPVVDITQAPKFVFIHPSDIWHRPLSAIRYLGIPLLGGLALYAWRRPVEKRDWILAVPIILYIPLFLYFFRGFWGVRYLAPIFPMLCVLSAKAICMLKSRRLLAIVVIGCVAQFAVTEAYMLIQRRLPAPMLEAYRWVCDNTKPDAGLMCLNAAVVPQTGRRAIWHSEASLPEIGYLLWEANESEAIKIFKVNGIDYVFVERDRVYDDRYERRLPAYPRSFLDKLNAWKSMQKVFENSAATIWEIPP